MSLSFRQFDISIWTCGIAFQQNKTQTIRETKSSSFSIFLQKQKLAFLSWKEIGVGKNRAKLESFFWSWKVSLQFESSRWSWKIDLNFIDSFLVNFKLSNFISYLLTSVVLSNLGQSFPSSVFRIHVKLSNSTIFPAKLSIYKYSSETVWSWKVNIEIGQLFL